MAARAARSALARVSATRATSSSSRRSLLAAPVHQQRAASTAVLRLAALAALIPARGVSAAAAAGSSSTPSTMGTAAPECQAAGECAHNPLLEDGPFPAYDRIKPEHVVPGMQSLLADLSAELDALEASLSSKTTPLSWATVVVPYERINDRLDRVWGAVDHLKSVRDSPDLRAAVDEVQPKRVEFGLRISQSRPLYDAFSALKADAKTWASLTAPQKRAVENELRDFKLGGVGLDGAEKERFNAIQQRLSQLSTSFSNHLLDATKGWTRLVTDPKGVAGLPSTARGLAAQQAAEAGHAAKADAEAGPWLITLDQSSYVAVQQHAADRALREDVYRAYVTRASTPGTEDDNQPLIDETLKLRKEKAALLGYPSFAALSMASKMATEESAGALLEQLRAASRPPAEVEMKEVEAYARAHGFPAGEAFKNWDVAYYAERVREEKYELSDEELRPYLALPNVLNGLFGLVKRLFDVDVVPADGKAPVWHPDTRFFELKKGGVNGETVAYFFFDPYARPAEKRAGAWMNEVVSRWVLPARDGGDGSTRLPVALMVCNQAPPVGDQPSLMTFRDVETVFHEMGHALQHMLTTGNDTLTSGIRGIEWDAVELPSQFMENFAYDKPTLLSFAKHWRTGEALPDALYKKLIAARNYREGSQTLRQVHLAMTDLFLHSSKYDPDAHPEGVYASRALAPIDAAATVMPPLPDDRFLCSFSHIFAGGYSAGYYSYSFALVMACDAFGAFEGPLAAGDEAGVRAAGLRFRDTVLSLGGGASPASVFEAFRGRGPTVDALLRQKGLVAGSAA